MPYKNKEDKAAWHAAHQAAKRAAWITFFGHVACTKCGYDKSFAAIDAHHLDPAIKEFGIAQWLHHAFNEKNKSIMTRELGKCVFLCRNCHAVLHENERNEVKNGIQKQRG